MEFHAITTTSPLQETELYSQNNPLKLSELHVQ